MGCPSHRRSIAVDYTSASHTPDKRVECAAAGYVGELIGHAVGVGPPGVLVSRGVFVRVRVGVLVAPPGRSQGAWMSPWGLAKAGRGCTAQSRLVYSATHVKAHSPHIVAGNGMPPYKWLLPVPTLGLATRSRLCRPSVLQAFGSQYHLRILLQPKRCWLMYCHS